jgi:hypothetical protein
MNSPYFSQVEVLIACKYKTYRNLYIVEAKVVVKKMSNRSESAGVDAPCGFIGYHYGDLGYGCNSRFSAL